MDAIRRVQGAVVGVLDVPVVPAVEVVVPVDVPVVRGVRVGVRAGAMPTAVPDVVRFVNYSVLEHVRIIVPVVLVGVLRDVQIFVIMDVQQHAPMIALVDAIISVQLDV